jgi:hypothetical protein
VVKRLAAVAIMLTLSGCAAQPPAPILTPVEVQVPVAVPVYCNVAKLDKPELPLAALNADSAPDDTVRAYAATVAILKGAVRERDLIIAGCAAPPPDEAPATINGPAAAKAPAGTK